MWKYIQINGVIVADPDACYYLVYMLASQDFARYLVTQCAQTSSNCGFTVHIKIMTKLLNDIIEYCIQYTTCAGDREQPPLPLLR